MRVPNGAAATVHGRRVDRQTQNGPSDSLPLCAGCMVYVCIFACMYMFTYVCMYMYVCMYVCTYMTRGFTWYKSSNPNARLCLHAVEHIHTIP